MKLKIFKSLMLGAFVFSSVGAMAQMTTESVTLSQSLQKQVHVLCHVIKLSAQVPQISLVNVHSVDLLVVDGKATITLGLSNASEGYAEVKYTDRPWSVVESYNDDNNKMQYETMVEMTNDHKNYLLVQFYTSNEEPRGLLQYNNVSYDLVCK